MKSEIEYWWALLKIEMQHLNLVHILFFILFIEVAISHIIGRVGHVLPWGVFWWSVVFAIGAKLILGNKADFY